MVRNLVMLTLVAACAAACSQSSQPQSTGSEQSAAPGASASAPAAAETATSSGTAASRPAETAPAAGGAARSSAPQTESSGAAPRSAPAGEPAAVASAAPSAPAGPAEPPKPQFRELTIPAGTSLSVKLLSNLASNTSHVEDAVKGSIAKPVVIDGTTALPEGTPISGTVTEASESGRVKGRASVGFRFDRLTIASETQKIQTATVTREAAADKKSDVKKGGIGAGLGAVVGGVVGGGKGAAIGAVAGGTGTVLATKGNEVEVPAGTTVSVLLQEPLTVTVPVK